MTRVFLMLVLIAMCHKAPPDDASYAATIKSLEYDGATLVIGGHRVQLSQRTSADVLASLHVVPTQTPLLLGDLAVEVPTPCGVVSTRVTTPMAKDEQARRDAHTYDMLFDITPAKLPPRFMVYVDGDNHVVKLGDVTLGPQQALWGPTCRPDLAVTIDGKEAAKVPAAGAADPHSLFITAFPDRCYTLRGVAYGKGMAGLGTSQELRSQSLYTTTTREIPYFLRSAPLSVPTNKASGTTELLQTPCR